MASPEQILADEAPLMRINRVMRITTHSRTTVWREVRAGRFPAPIAISPGRKAWYRDDIVSWLKSRRSKWA